MTTRERISGWIVAALAALALGAAVAARATEQDAEGALLSRLEGGWSGTGNATPMGPMPVSVLFDRQADGSLRSRTSLNRETYFELWFSQAQDGRWMLYEEAGMEGLGVQAYTLGPAGSTGDGYRWVYEPDPEFLTVDVAVADDRMVLDVRLRGEPHVLFELDRVPAADLPEMRRGEAVQACQSPEEGISLAELMTAGAAAGGGDAAEAGSDPIASARRAVVERPTDGRAHLDLARALGNVINENPATGPRYAHEMLTSLQKAIELEPDLTEAYHWLVGYYLNAPPIAGGSLERAEEAAGELSRLDPEGAAGLLQQIAVKRDGR